MIWRFKEAPLLEQVKDLQKQLGPKVPKLISELLVQRGITTFEQARHFFRPSLDDLHDPFLMKDMDRAVNRLEEAIAQGERILVYGDYDVDGTTAVALMYTFLQEYSNDVATYIPDRYKEGYGLSMQGIDFAHDNGFTLIIALDCGIKALEQVDYAASLGIDLIIADHHRPDSEWPNAEAVLNPKRPDCSYPYKELCGCGVGFKLAQAFLVRRGEDKQKAYPLLDLVATAIGADIVPVTGENRILAWFGLSQLNKAGRPGLRELLKNRKKEEYDLSDLIFSAAPRINAAGRMLHGSCAVDLLSSEDPRMVQALAEQIEELNIERRETEKRTTEQAFDFIEKNQLQDRLSTVVYQEDWHKGVIGIVASRLMEKYYRPTVVFTKSDDDWVASARSIPGFDLYEGLQACQEHLLQFGGHTFAAGLRLKEQQLHAFVERFEEVVAEQLGSERQQKEILIDKEVRLEELNESFYKILKQFAPFGPENAAPLFCSRELLDTGRSRKVGADQSHIKVQLSQQGKVMDGIGFSLALKWDSLFKEEGIDVVFRLEENVWKDQKSLQLGLEDLRPSGSASSVSFPPSNTA